MAVKLVYCIRRKPELSREEFQQYWKEQHAPLVAKMAEKIGMTRYVQSHTFDTPMNAGMADPRGGLEPYDGLMEGWWDSEEEALAAVTSEAGSSAMQQLFADEAKFIDFTQSPLFMTAEHIIY